MIRRLLAALRRRPRSDFYKAINRFEDGSPRPEVTEGPTWLDMVKAIRADESNVVPFQRKGK